MACPNGHTNAPDGSGLCKVCGAPTLDAAPATAADGTATTDIPEWRRELSRRLLALREKREAGTADTAPLPFPETPEPPADERAPAPLSSATPEVRPPRRRVAPKLHLAAQDPRGMAAPPLPDPRVGADPKPPRARLPIEADTGLPTTAATAASDSTIRHLIDVAVARYAPESSAGPSAAATEIGSGSGTTHPAGASGVSAPGAHVKAPATAPAPGLGEPPADRTILLSRTLSGLIDLLIVFFWGASLVLAAEIFSGIAIFDLRSRIHYGLMLVAIHFVYSFFFLGCCGQTIGMMITELKVVAMPGGRLSSAQVLMRSVLFVPAILVAGLGLLQALLDSRARCLHDVGSRTEVVRLEL